LRLSSRRKWHTFRSKPKPATDQATSAQRQTKTRTSPLRAGSLSQAHTQLQSDIRPFPTANCVVAQISNQERQGYSWQNTAPLGNTACRQVNSPSHIVGNLAGVIHLDALAGFLAAWSCFLPEVNGY